MFFIIYVKCCIIRACRIAFPKRRSPTCMSFTSSSLARICSGSSMGSFRLLMKLYNTAVATIIVRDVCNFVWRVVERHWNSLFQTPMFRVRICVHYICVAVGFADQLLPLDIGGMDNRYHQIIYPGYHHARSNCAHMRLLSNILASCTLPG
jgi:hypothetical protein